MNECNCGLKRIGFRYQSNSLYREEKESSLDAAGLNKQLKTKNSWMNVMNETGRCVNFINQINLINSFTCLGLVFSIQSSFFWDWFRSTIRESIRKKNWMKNQCRLVYLFLCKLTSAFINQVLVWFRLTSVSSASIYLLL